MTTAMIPVGNVLTARQRQLLTFLCDYQAEHGCPVTYRDMMAAMGISNINGIRAHLAAIARKGFVRLTVGTRRSVQVLRGPDSSWVRCWGHVWLRREDAIREWERLGVQLQAMREEEG